MEFHLSLLQVSQFCFNINLTLFDYVKFSFCGFSPQTGKKRMLHLTLKYIVLYDGDFTFRLYILDVVMLQTVQELKLK